MFCVKIGLSLIVSLLNSHCTENVVFVLQLSLKDDGLTTTTFDRVRVNDDSTPATHAMFVNWGSTPIWRVEG